MWTTPPNCVIRTDFAGLCPSAALVTDAAPDVFSHKKLPTSAEEIAEMDPTEDNAVARDEEMRTRAEVVFKALTLKERVYAWRGNELPSAVAMQSEPLVTALLKTGLFAINIQSMVTLTGGPDAGKLPVEAVPSFLLGMGADYAVSVAPQMAGAPEGEVIDVAQLVAAVEKLESVMGDIPVDARLISEVCGVARKQLALGVSVQPSAGANS